MSHKILKIKYNKKNALSDIWTSRADSSQLFAMFTYFLPQFLNLHVDFYSCSRTALMSHIQSTKAYSSYDC